MHDLPLQHIDSVVQDCFELADLTHIAPTKLESVAAGVAQDFMDKRIDLSTGPLFEATLLKLSDHDHVLIVAVDHLVSDATSLAILNREIWTSYHQTVDEKLVALPDLPIQFADYAVWQQNTYESWLSEHEQYWRQRLSGAPCTRLIPDNKLTTTEHPVIARLYLPFGKALSAKLHEIARREQLRLPLVVLTVYVIVMSHWCDQRDLVISFISHGRHDHHDLNNMIGPLAHVLYFRIEICADDSFLDVLKKIQLEFDSAHQHRDFDRVPDLIPELSTDLRFNWLPTGSMPPVHSLHKNDQAITSRLYPLKSGSTPNILPFFSGTASGINVTVTYRSDLFMQDTIEWFGRNLRLVAEAFAANPLCYVNEVAPAKERIGVRST